MSIEESQVRQELLKANVRIKALVDQIDDMTLKQVEMCKKTMKLAKLFGISERKLIEIWKEL